MLARLLLFTVLACAGSLLNAGLLGPGKLVLQLDEAVYRIVLNGNVGESADALAKRRDKELNTLAGSHSCDYHQIIAHYTKGRGVALYIAPGLLLPGGEAGVAPRAIVTVRVLPGTEGRRNQVETLESIYKLRSFDDALAADQLDKEPKVRRTMDPAGVPGKEGKAVVRILVNPYGTVEDVKIVSSTDPVFEKPAFLSMLGFQLDPPTKGGKAVSAWFEFPLTFKKG